MWFSPLSSTSFGTSFGIPWLYTETPGGGRSTPEDVTCYAEGALNVMKHLEMLPGEPQPLPTAHHLIGDGNLDLVISAPEAGFFKSEVALLEEVRAGQRLGTIQDFFGQTSAEVVTQQDGRVILLRKRPRVQVGAGLVQVTGTF